MVSGSVDALVWGHGSGMSSGLSGASAAMGMAGSSANVNKGNSAEAMPAQSQTMIRKRPDSDRLVCGSYTSTCHVSLLAYPQSIDMTHVNLYLVVME